MAVFQYFRGGSEEVYDNSVKIADPRAKLGTKTSGTRSNSDNYRNGTFDKIT
jgi:hypothetical protein